MPAENVLYLAKLYIHSIVVNLDIIYIFLRSYQPIMTFIPSSLPNHFIGLLLKGVNMVAYKRGTYSNIWYTLYARILMWFVHLVKIRISSPDYC